MSMNRLDKTGNQIQQMLIDWAKPTGHPSADMGTVGHDQTSVHNLVSSETFKDFTVGFMSGNTQKMQESLYKMADLAVERRTNFTNKGSAMGAPLGGEEGRIFGHEQQGERFKDSISSAGNNKQQMVETLKKILTYMFPLGVPGGIANAMKISGMMG